MKLLTAAKYVSFALLLWGLPHVVAAEEIINYQVDLTVNQDSTVNVEEVITYDFGTDQRHGIFRNIPYKYKVDLGSFKLRLSDVSVTDQEGSSIQFEQSTSGDEVVLKIGDPDAFVTGVNIYRINYTVKRAVNYFDTHDELYWNVIGTKWTVPISNSQATVTTPALSTEQICFVGSEGSTQQSCKISGQDSRYVSFLANQTLTPGEGFTIAVKLPPGTLIQPTLTEKIWDIVQDNGIVALPIIVFLVMLYLWNKYGRDHRGRGTVVVQYDAPDKLHPIYMGTLVDGKLDKRDFAAEIIRFAVDGYVSIKKIETKKLLFFTGSDFELTKLKELPQEFPAQSRALFNAFFASADSVKLSDFKNDVSFGKSIAKIPKAVIKDLTSKGYWRHNPQTSKGLTIGVGVFIIWGASIFLTPVFGGLGVASAIISGVIIVLFGLLMPALTFKGAVAKEHILGLKQYLSVAEKDRLKFHNDPGKLGFKTPAQFEKLLPYAVALGVEEEWAKQFQDVYTKQPDWYTDSTGQAFNAAVLSSSINNFSGSLQSAVANTSTASSGGSGFSGGGVGGGGGGGGGGSW